MLQIEFKPVEGKSPLAMELIADRYRKAEAPRGLAARVRRSFHEDLLEGNSRPPRRDLHAPIIRAPALHAVIEIIALPANFTAIKENPLRRIRQDQGTAGISRAMEDDFSRPERGRACGARRA